MSTLVVAWWTVLKRLAADWLILTAAVVTVVLATVLLASGPIYADAVTLSALQRSLLDAPVRDAYLNIGQRLPADLYDTVDRLVVEAVAETFSPAGVDVLLHTKSESFDLPISTSNGTVELAVFEHFEAIARPRQSHRRKVATRHRRFRRDINPRSHFSGTGFERRG